MIPNDVGERLYTIRFGHEVRRMLWDDEQIISRMSDEVVYFLFHKSRLCN